VREIFILWPLCFVRNFFILFSAFTTSRTLTYYTQRKRETRERERRRKEVIAEEEEEEYLAALLFRARDFLIESERIPRRFRGEEQKSLAHSFVRSFV